MYFEDFKLGLALETPSRTVTAADITNFCCLSGDFNEVPDMPTLDIFRNSGLVDVMEGSEKYSYNKKPYLTRIDYGLMTPERQKDLGRAEILDELGDHNLRACSDHFPLLLEWE